MWRMGTEAGHCVFCSEDSCNEGPETKDHGIAVAFPLPRGKMSSDLSAGYSLLQWMVTVFPLFGCSRSSGHSPV